MRKEIVKICCMCFSVLFVNYSLMAADFITDDTSTSELSAIAKALVDSPEKDAIYNEIARRRIEQLNALAENAVQLVERYLEKNDLANAGKMVSYVNTPFIQEFLTKQAGKKSAFLLDFLQNELVLRQMPLSLVVVEAHEIPSLKRPMVSSWLAMLFTFQALVAIRSASSSNGERVFTYYSNRKAGLIDAMQNAPIADPAFATNNPDQNRVIAFATEYARTPEEARHRRK